MLLLYYYKESGEKLRYKDFVLFSYAVSDLDVGNSMSDDWLGLDTYIVCQMIAWSKEYTSGHPL